MKSTERPLRRMAALLLLAALARIFVIPRFRYEPGKLQLLLETTLL